MAEVAEKQTMDEIAVSILGGADTPAPTPEDAGDDSPQGGDDEALEAVVEDQAEDEVDGEVEEVSESDEDDETILDEDEAGEEQAAPEPYLDVQDEDLIEVKIDGKWEKRTIADAKRALSGEGAIEKRLKEVTEARKEAQAVKQQSIEQAQTQVNVLRHTVEQMGQALFEPRVSAPDEQLLSTNPNEYHKRDLQYRKETERVNTLKQQFGAVFQHLNQEMQTQQQEFRKEQQQLLHEKLPVLRDEKLGKQRQQQILDAAAHYGFSKQEISLAADHRLFMMAHDAAMYRAIQEKGSEVKVGKRTPSVPRTLRSGQTTAKTKARQSQKQRDAIVNRAKETGKVDDIVATITQPARRRR